MNPIVPHTVTIFNAVGNSYSGTVLSSVRCIIKSGGGSASGCVYIILAYVDSEKPFVPYRDWRHASDEAKMSSWTAAEDGSDIIVPYECDTGCTDPLAIAEAMPVKEAVYRPDEGELSQIILTIGV